MTLDIVLLIVTIIVAVAAVIVSLLRAVLERRRSRRPWTERAPREMDAGRLGRAAPPTEARVGSAPTGPAEARGPIPVMALLIPPDPPPVSRPPVPVTADVEAASGPVASVQADTVPAASSAAPPATTSGLGKRKRGARAAASAPVIATSAPGAWRDGDQDEPEPVTDPELAYRIGVPGAHRPSRPAVLVVADGERRAVSLPGTVATESWPGPPRRRRRAALRVAAAATALASVMAAVIVLPDFGQQGAVLGETGRPAISSDTGNVPVETPVPTPPAVTAEPTASPTPQATPTPAPTASPSPPPPSASSAEVKVASVTPRPRDTPRPATPTPKPTPTPTPKPAATPTAKPTRTPTPTPVPSPIAFFHCSSDGLSLTLDCDGTESSDATSYLWDFDDGGTSTDASPSHQYLLPGRYDVSLTVSNSAGSNETDQPFIVP